jgi:hypothetical protein
MGGDARRRFSVSVTSAFGGIADMPGLAAWLNPVANDSERTFEVVFDPDQQTTRAA